MARKQTARVWYRLSPELAARVAKIGQSMGLTDPSAVAQVLFTLGCADVEAWQQSLQRRRASDDLIAAHVASALVES